MVAPTKGDESVQANPSNQSGQSAFLSGKMSQVDVKAIQSELNKLWQNASTAKPGEDVPQIVRACSTNLILYTDRPDAETEDSAILDEIVQMHPARAILTICRPSESKKLEAWVSARCHLAAGSGTRQVCSEQITVVAEGDVEQELISVIDSLMLGDLPVFVWWAIDDLNGERIAPFLTNAKRLIVDSAKAPYSFNFLRDLHSLVDCTLDCIYISDLNWRRLLGIRSAIAEEFERAPFSIAELKNIQKVSISSCGHELSTDDCSIQALQLVGWLAARLGWEAVSIGKDSNADSTTAKYKIDDKNIDVIFKSTPMDHVSPGSIFEVEIELSTNKKLRVSRDPSGEADSLVVTVYEDGKRIREILADDSDLDRVHLVGFELEELVADHIFAKSVAATIQLLELIEVVDAK